MKITQINGLDIDNVTNEVTILIERGMSSERILHITVDGLRILRIKVDPFYEPSSALIYLDDKTDTVIKLDNKLT